MSVTVAGQSQLKLQDQADPQANESSSSSSSASASSSSSSSSSASSSSASASTEEQRLLGHPLALGGSRWQGSLSFQDSIESSYTLSADEVTRDPATREQLQAGAEAGAGAQAEADAKVEAPIARFVASGEHSAFGQSTKVQIAFDVFGASTAAPHFGIIASEDH